MTTNKPRSAGLFFGRPPDGRQVVLREPAPFRESRESRPGIAIEWLEFRAMRITLIAALLLALCAPLSGCKRSLDEQDVREFIDLADNAARKRYAPEICELRGENFTLHMTFQSHEERDEPTELELNRKLYCKKLSSFSRVRQYLLERNSIDIDVAADGKTAKVTADYV